MFKFYFLKIPLEFRKPEVFSESPAYHSSFDPKRHQSSIRYSPKGEIQSTSHNPVKTFGFRTNEVCLKW